MGHLVGFPNAPAGLFYIFIVNAPEVEVVLLLLELFIIDLIILMALTALGGCFCLGYIHIKRIIHCSKYEGSRVVRFPKWYNY